MMKKAVIFGVTGQDGSYLAELLLGKGYAVIGVARRTSTGNQERIRHILSNPAFKVVDGDVTDASSVYRVLDTSGPDEIYNLAAQSHVGVSFAEPAHTWQATACGALHILEWLRSCYRSPRFYQASSSEMFGAARSRRLVKDIQEYFQDETTNFLPNSPYAVAKLAAHHLCRIYREAYGIFACSGILFNHESPRRGDEFVTRKIARYVASMSNTCLRDDCYCCQYVKLHLGNLDAKRDWGHARDYVRAMWMMLQHKKPDDFVIATGETHSVQEFLDAAWATAGFQPEVLSRFVQSDPSLLRPCEVPFLRGDASKARNELGWSPSVTFADLVKEMVLYEMDVVL